MANGKNQAALGDFFSKKETVQYFLMALLAVLTLWIGVKFLDEARGLSNPEIGAPTINISGEGKVLAKPDVGTVNLSVVASSLDASLAQNEATGQINKIMNFLTKSGIEEKDIKTISYSISPQYDFPKGKRKFLGYEVRQTAQVKIRDINKVGAVVSGTAEFGAIEIGELRFTVDNEEALKAEARVKAIADAKAKAKILAKDLGVRIGAIVSFSEYGGPVPIYGYAAGFGAGGDFEKSVAPSIPTGENEIISNVNITFEIR